MMVSVRINGYVYWRPDSQDEFDVEDEDGQESLQRKILEMILRTYYNGSKDTSRKPFIQDNDTKVKIGIDLPIRRGDDKDGFLRFNNH